MIEPGLCLVGLDVSSDEAAIRALSQALFRAGKVAPGFEAAAVARERRSPTGLPLPGGAIAIPHAEPEYVRSPSMAIAKLVREVEFREMGNPAVRLNVALVVMPALTARDQAEAGLARILELLRDDGLRAELRAAKDAIGIHAVFARRWSGE